MITHTALAVAAAIGALAMGFPVAASAADLSARPAYKAPVPVIAPAHNWTGFYVGGVAGYGWGDTHHFVEGFNADTGDFDLRGSAFGGLVGFNLQAGSWVFGIESDWSHSNIKGASGTGNFGGYDCQNDPGCRTRVKSFGTTRVRLGYAHDRLLAFITGGVAYGKLEADIFDSIDVGFSGGERRSGWTAGGGLEYALWQQWSAKLEYLHVDLGDFIYGQPPNATGSASSARFGIVRGGINFKFGPWGGPVVARY